MRRRFLVLISGTLVLAAISSAQGEGRNRASIGEVVAEVKARDVLGATFSLSQLDRDKFVVFAFLGVDCPLAKLYTLRLVELAREYRPKGVIFIAVDSNRQDSASEIAAYGRRHAIEFPILKDLRQTIADRLGAMRTPQIVVLDRDRKIRYRGRIDDQFGFMRTNRTASYRKPKPERNDLRCALDELLAGRPVSVAETEPTGCLIGRDRVPIAHPSVTYARDVAPILNRRCVTCHRPMQIGPFALTSYEEVAGWADMIAEVTQLNRMPPWHADPEAGSFLNDSRLSDEEKRVLAEWVTAGAPQGDPKDLPQPPHFANGWMMPEPDEIIYMSKKSFSVPATGVVPYQVFIVDPGWKEDRWISAIELRPGNRSVVHHILVFALPANATAFDPLRADESYFAGFSPGLQPEELPSGFARPFPAGSKLLFNIHYTPNGSPQEDRSYLGLKFADPRSVVREVTVSCAFNKTFQIPPGAFNQEVRSQYVFQRDSLMLSLIPHMHLRGKDFCYEATYPDGRREMLLSVPHYDFGWQTTYRLREPKLMPRGTVVNCIAHYDNSEANLNNPNPKAIVGWGDQTFDEMMTGFFEIAPAAEGLVRRIRWWTPLLSGLSAEGLVAMALTTINVVLIGVLVVATIRSRRRSRAHRASSRWPAAESLIQKL